VCSSDLVYDEFYHDRGEEQDFLNALAGSTTSAVLELACGTGVLASAMAKAHPKLTVHGLDRSEKMLELARRRAPGLSWHKGDMTDFQLDQDFDLIICGFNSVQHLLSDDAVRAFLRCCHRHLCSTGRLCIDLFNPSPEFTAGPRQNCFVTRFTSASLGKEVELYEDTDYDVETRILDIVYHYRQTNGELIRSTPYQMRQYFPGDLDCLIEECALTTRQLWGDLKQAPFTPTSPKQIYVCGRAS